MELKAIIVALLIGALMIVSMVSYIGDFGRPETYNASLSSDTQGKLTNMSDKLRTPVMGLSKSIQNKLNDSAINSQDQTTSDPANSFNPTVIYGVGWSAFTMMFQLPSIVYDFLVITLQVLPFGAELAFAFTIIIGIISILVVLAGISAILKWGF